MNGQRKTAMTFRMALCLLVLMVGMVTPTPQQAKAQAKTFASAREGFAYQWDYSDGPVAAEKVKRTWLWGPAPVLTRTELLLGAPGDAHLVQYYDKARMEFDAKKGMVTNGLLVVEMISGSIQKSLPPANEFLPFLPNRLPIAGDTGATHPDTPSYASLFSIATIGGDGPRATPRPVGTRIRETYTRSGVTGILTSSIASTLTPTVGTFYPPGDPLGHNIPDVFVNFLTQKGLVSNGPDTYRTDYLFENNDWVNAVGLPITEPYWTQALIKGKNAWVLFQAFQRRILTYTPSENDPLWRVEMGNVGQHYMNWRPDPFEPSPLGGVRVIESSINNTAEACLGISELCPPEKVVTLPRSFLTILRSNDSWARTKVNGRMLLHSDNVAYDLKSSAMLVIKRIDNSVDSVQQQSGRVDYMHGPKRLIEIATGTGLVTAIGTHFSIIMTGTDQLGIIVPDDGGSVTLQPPSPGGGLPAPAPIEVLSSTVLLIPRVQSLTAIRSQPASYTIRPTTPDEEDYWDKELERLRSFPELEELTRPSAAPNGPSSFARQWEYSDKAVADGRAARTWLWGPAPLGPARPERMVGSPQRGTTPADYHLVLYYDKARMEFNAKEGTVTSGRLVLEMMSGKIQTSLAGDEAFSLLPFALPIAGDVGDPNALTYASLLNIATIGGKGARATPSAIGTRITAAYARSGTIWTLPANAVASTVMPTVGTFYPPGDPNGHNIPNVFVDFLTQRGPVWSNPPGQYRTDYLFANNNWVAAMGLPITEPYWTQVRVGGRDSWIMFQAFERRILIYNPSAADPLWRVEMGNVGLHYYKWRPEPLVASPSHGVQVVQSSPDPQTDVCLVDGAIDGSCPSGQLVTLPRSLPALLQPQNSWARTRPKGWILLHSDNAIYDMQSEAMLLFKRIDNSVDSVQQRGGQVDYLHGPKKIMTINTDVGQITAAARFSIILPNAVPPGGVQLRIVVPNQGGSVRLQLTAPSPNLPAPAPIAVESGQVLTVIKGQPVSHTIRPIAPYEEQYWAEKVNRLRSIPELKELTRLSEVSGRATTISGLIAK